MKSSSGITLTEVLVIVVVFFVLLGLVGSVPFGCGLPADITRRVSAKNDAVQIAAAIAAYQTEYGRFPSTNGEVQDVGGPILEALVGTPSPLNPRQIVFLELQTARKGKSGQTNGVFVDPWGFAYKMKLDADGDKRIANVGPACSPTAEITNAVVAVWNDPDYHSDRPEAEAKKKRAANSWR